MRSAGLELGKEWQPPEFRKLQCMNKCSLLTKIVCLCS